MIILDTNIISELMKITPAASVIAWFEAQDVNQLFITSITIAEINYGINVLPNGTRKQNLLNSFHQVLREGFQHRQLSFDERAANVYGEIMAKRKVLGRPFNILDGQIAAIALTNHGKLATRNIADFLECSLDLINPFTFF